MTTKEYIRKKNKLKLLWCSLNFFLSLIGQICSELEHANKASQYKTPFKVPHLKENLMEISWFLLATASVG